MLRVVVICLQAISFAVDGDDAHLLVLFSADCLVDVLGQQQEEVIFAGSKVYDLVIEHDTVTFSVDFDVAYVDGVVQLV